MALPLVVKMSVTAVTNALKAQLDNKQVNKPIKDVPSAEPALLALRDLLNQLYPGK